MSSTIKLSIKNPAGSTSFTLDVSPDATLAEVQRLLAERYEGNPSPELQTLIFAGKVLKDQSASVRQLVEKHGSLEGPHSFHLVIRKPKEQSSAGAAPVAKPSEITGTASHSASSQNTSEATGFGNATSPEAAPGAAGASSAPHAQEQPPHANEQGAASAAGQTPQAYYPHMYINPVYAAAYQAAYSAALQANAQAGGQRGAPMAQPIPMAYYPCMLMYPQMYMPVAGMQQQAQYQTMPQAMVTHFMQGGLNDQEVLVEALPREALLARLAGIRHRRGHQPGAAGAGAAQEGRHMHGHHRHAQQRPRVGITLRINIRTILQVLVFAMLLYQHFTWHRFMALVLGGLVLYLTSTWAPLRRALAALHQPPPPPPQRPAAQPAAAQQEAQPRDSNAAAPAAGAAQQARPRGMLHEILVLILGFITSLLPAWNFNPDEAAAFAAAEAVAAQEEQREQQQQAAGGFGAMPAEAAAVGGEQGQEPPVPGVQADENAPQPIAG